MSSNGNKYGLSLLKRKRGALASEIIQTDQKLRQLRSDLHNVDATLRILDPSISIDAIPIKRPRKRVKFYRQGELSRLIRDAFREAGDEPISLHDLVSKMMEQGNHGEESRIAIRSRVRSNLHHLERKGVIRKVGEQRKAKWVLI